MYNDKFKNDFVKFVKDLYFNYDFIPLHAPVFLGNEKKYLAECIDSTYVSYVGEFVTKFENSIKSLTNAKHAIAVVNGTVALQIALHSVGVKPDTEVITQSLTFVATINAISHNFAKPVFIDVDKDTLGMSPEKLSLWLKNNSTYNKGTKKIINKFTGKEITAILPVHIFGHPCKIDEIISIANEYNIPVVEDAAESIGSFYNNQHTGTFGKIGILSFNGNKTITTGGGGMILTNDESIASYIKHITTTAKLPHPYEFIHDKIAYNFRMPNVNAAIGFAQMEYSNQIFENKRETFNKYLDFLKPYEINLIIEPKNSTSNYWLNALIFDNIEQRNNFLEFTNNNKIQTRAIWRLMNMFDMYKNCQTDDLTNSKFYYERVVNIPSGYRL
ncbi:MAG TPA: LegC family aminotransferase [Ignavibacteriales bacterium]|nr:LegC family aminotransferase [Ignavibacteriales bacterium]HPD68576.1 LegC family aminotransferase [Ignavibacteriales bacterium]HRR18960.1 LegC family aminotransferase [Ignavibacteriales bacterium]